MLGGKGRKSGHRSVSTVRYGMRYLSTTSPITQVCARPVLCRAPVHVPAAGCGLV